MLDHGRFIMEGVPSEVMEHYRKSLDMSLADVAAAGTVG
jgi:hypothetical protein